jgi:hypothetical protein
MAFDFNKLYEGSNWGLSTPFDRKDNLPIDCNSLFPSKALADAYATGVEATINTAIAAYKASHADSKIEKLTNNSYVGQIITVIEKDAETGNDVATVYVIEANRTLKAVGTAYDDTELRELIDAIDVGVTSIITTDDSIVELTPTTATDGAVTITGAHAKKGPTNGYTSGNTTTSVGTGTNSIKIPQLTVDAYGHVTAASDETISISIPAAPEYSITKDSNSGEYAAVYHLTKAGTNVGTAINIPKDMMVQSGTVSEIPEIKYTAYPYGYEGSVWMSDFYLAGSSAETEPQSYNPVEGDKLVAGENSVGWTEATYQINDNDGHGYWYTSDGEIVTPKECDILLVSGQTAGTYIVLTLANANNDKIYVNVGNLIEYVTSGSAEGDMVFVTVDPSTHKVTATITDGTITKEKLDSTVQASLKAADEANAYTDAEIKKLDVTITGMGAGKTIKTLTETDGKIAAEFQDIAITKSQITDFEHNHDIAYVKRSDMSKYLTEASPAYVSILKLPFPAVDSKATNDTQILLETWQNSGALQVPAGYPINIGNIDLDTHTVTYSLDHYKSDNESYILKPNTSYEIILAYPEDDKIRETKYVTSDNSGYIFLTLSDNLFVRIGEDNKGICVDFKDNNYEDQRANMQNAEDYAYLSMYINQDVALNIEKGAQVNAIDTVSNNFEIVNKELRLANIDKDTKIANTKPTEEAEDLSLLDFINSQIANSNLANEQHTHQVADIVGLKEYIEENGYTVVNTVYDDILLDGNEIEGDHYVASENYSFEIQTLVNIKPNTTYGIIIDSIPGELYGIATTGTTIHEQIKFYSVDTPATETGYSIYVNADSIELSLGNSTGAGGVRFTVVELIPNLNLKATATETNTGLVKSTVATKYDAQGNIVDTEDNINTINKIHVDNDGTMTVNAISVDKLENKDGYTLVLFGGNAAGN